jgi:hypothetical protein
LLVFTMDTFVGHLSLVVAHVSGVVMTESWDVKRKGYLQAIEVLRAHWPYRHEYLSGMTVRRAIAQAKRCR